MSNQISIEGQFNIASFNVQVDQMSEAQKTSMLKELYAAHVTQREGFEKLLRHKWGLTDNSSTIN